MPTVLRKTRRTPERILDTTLALFNRFGEPNVSTTLISAELRISPGNLYYHYASKEVLINTLFDRYEAALERLLQAAGDVRHVEDAWLFFHMLFELIWQHRFLYRDLNDLLSKSRHLETRFQSVLSDKSRAVGDVLAGMSEGGALRMSADEAGPVATAMVVVLTYWLSFEYVMDPRRALEPESAGDALVRGAFHLLSLLSPYLEPGQRLHFLALASHYRPAVDVAGATAPSAVGHRPMQGTPGARLSRPVALKASR